MPEEMPLPDDPTVLIRLLEVREHSPVVWRQEELPAILRHHLSCPLGQALGSYGGEAEHYMKRLVDRPEPLRTLDDLLHDDHPSPQLLILTKRFAKRCSSDANQPLPREIALLLYYAAIAVAEMRCDQSISALTLEALIRGLQRQLTYTWLDPRTRELLADATRCLIARAPIEAKPPPDEV